MDKRCVFFISGGTGITASNIGSALLSQFDVLEFEFIYLTFITTTEQVQDAIEDIHKQKQLTILSPIVFSTLVNPELRALLQTSDAIVFDIFDTYISKLEHTFGIEATQRSGTSHAIDRIAGDYTQRLDSINYTLGNDDGVNVREYDNADIILIGVSRCGKTPTCVYLSLQLGLYAANYPLLEEDLTTGALPKVLQPYKDKIFGLTINPFRLKHIRTERRQDSVYASLSQCQKEIRSAEQLYKQCNIKYLDTSNSSIEEIAVQIMSATGMKRRYG